MNVGDSGHLFGGRLYYSVYSSHFVVFVPIVQLLGNRIRYSSVRVEASEHSYMLAVSTDIHYNVMVAIRSFPDLWSYPAGVMWAWVCGSPARSVITRAGLEGLR